MDCERCAYGIDPDDPADAYFTWVDDGTGETLAQHEQCYDDERPPDLNREGDPAFNGAFG